MMPMDKATRKTTTPVPIPGRHDIKVYLYILTTTQNGFNIISNVNRFCLEKRFVLTI